MLTRRRFLTGGGAGLALAAANWLMLPRQAEAAGCPYGCGMPYGPLHRHLAATAVDFAWQHRVITRESGWDPWAKNPRSSAAGLCQYLDWIWVWLEEEGLAAGSPYDGYAAIDAMNRCLERGYWWMWAETA